MRVLIVEDEEQLADAIARGLRLHAIAVDVAYDGQDALELASYVDYDVVVLDRDLPEVHGDDVCRELAAAGAAPRILMLTAAGRVRDRVAGLALGADDYLVKPFAFAELVARVRTLGRRAPRAVPAVLERCGVRLDPARRTVTRDGREITLTRKEFDLLRRAHARTRATWCPPPSCAGASGTSSPTRAAGCCGSPSPRCAASSGRPR